MSISHRALWILSLVISLILPFPARAAEPPPLTTNPGELRIAGTLARGAFAASLRLRPTETLSEVQLFATDLRDATGDAHQRDPVPASAVTLLPATEFPTLTAGSLTQVVVQIAPPAEAGTYTGTLVVHWTEPESGQIEVPLTLVARSRPALSFLSTEQLTMRGVQGQILRRRVVLRETTLRGSPLTGLQVVPQDLLSAEGEVLPASHVTVTLPAAEIAGGELLTATLEFQLDKVPAGAYNGVYLFSHDDEAPLSLPVTVNVRHGPGVALLALLIGAVLGLGIVRYQNRGKSADELTVRIVRLRNQMEAEDGPRAGFHDQMEMWLRKAEGALQVRNWEVAQAAVDEAKKLLAKWHEADWSAQITYLEELREEIRKQMAETDEAIALQAQDNAVTAMLEEMPKRFANPAAVRDEALKIETTLRRFRDALARHEVVNELWVSASNAAQDPALAQQWKMKLKALKRELYRLPGDRDAWVGWEGELEGLANEMLKALRKPEPGEGAKGDLDQSTANLVRQVREALGTRSPVEVPPLSAELTPGDARRAQRNLRSYDFLTQFLGGLTLTLVGYATLYAPNLTFGDNLSDYLALLAWGLGAQTTFADVAGLLRGWGIQWGDEEG